MSLVSSSQALLTSFDGKGFDRGKNRISPFFVAPLDFFHGPPDFPLLGVDKSGLRVTYR